MQPPSERRGFWRLPCAFVGLVLVSTGLGKLLDLPGFVHFVAQYDLMPSAGDHLVAYTLPFVELATGACLLARFQLRTAAASAVVLHVLLVSVVAVTLWRGIHLDNCGCFGVFLVRPLGPQTFEYDPDLLFGGELPSSLATDVANGLLGRLFLGHGSYLLSESRTLSSLFPRFGPNSADGEHGIISSGIRMNSWPCEILSLSEFHWQSDATW